MLSRAVRLGFVAASATLTVAACVGDAADEPLGAIEAPLTFAKVQPLPRVSVKGAGELDVETEYLPQVVCCEHGGAHIEALKAQAVMARTYMAFRYFGDGLGTAAKPLSGTTADQAYFCRLETSAACTRAVLETKGQITAYTNAEGDSFANVSFFVDGPRPACLADKSCVCPPPSPSTSMSPEDHPDSCSCFDFSSQGAANPAFVTYNWSRSGEDVTGSTIGDPANESNRGCASQNVQNCLAYAGWTYPDMLRMFYGQDIELRLMDGSVLPPPSGEPSVASGEASAPAASEPDAEGGRESGCSVVRGGAATAGSGGTYALALILLLSAARARRRSTPPQV